MHFPFYIQLIRGTRDKTAKWTNSFICRTTDLLILPSPAIDFKSGRLCICVVVWSFVRLAHSSDVTLAFDDAQFIQPFSREETDNTDDTDGKGSAGKNI